MRAAGRRQFILGLAAVAAGAAVGQTRRYRVAFANLTEDPSVRLEGLGFSGAEVRRSFELAARTLPLDMIYYDNAADADRALANAVDAIARKVDLLIEYNADETVNAAIADRAKAAAIPVIAINYPVGDAPLYTADNDAAGRIAGQALGQFARQNWPDEAPMVVIAGDVADTSLALARRLAGVKAGLGGELPDLAPVLLDTTGHATRLEGLLLKLLKARPERKLLIATLDDATALAARNALDLAGRLGDAVIASQGLDRSIHGGANDKKEIDPSNRGSALIGSTAYYLDRYGYEILPLALTLLRGEPTPSRTVTKHVLISAKTIFQVYPPFDMN